MYKALLVCALLCLAVFAEDAADAPVESAVTRPHHGTHGPHRDHTGGHHSGVTGFRSGSRGPKGHKGTKGPKGSGFTKGHSKGLKKAHKNTKAPSA
ncbi:unnamed protein product, partial [Mesorhabditis spiculigera]